MRYFIDANVDQQQMTVLAEDGRELIIHANDENADVQVGAFFDANSYGPATVWMYDAEITRPFVTSLGVPAEVKDLKDWASAWHNPTLPGRTAGVPGSHWVRDAWAFMCRYTGESMAAEPVPLAPSPGVPPAPPLSEESFRQEQEEGSPKGGDE